MAPRGSRAPTYLLQPSGQRAILTTNALQLWQHWGSMDALNKWFDEATSTPAGSILLFLAVFLARVAIDQWTQRRALSRAAKKRRTTGA